MCKLKDRIDDDPSWNTDYKKVNMESFLNISATQVDNPDDKRFREDMLKKIMISVKHNKDLHLNNRLDLLLNFGERRCKSMEGLWGSDKETDPREIKSYPHSPKNKDDIQFFDKNSYTKPQKKVAAKQQDDDVFSMTLGGPLKSYNDANQQVLPQDIDGIFDRKQGDLLKISDDKDKSKKTTNRKRGRKNQYYA